MKMASHVSTVDRDSATVDTSFKIKASSKAFKILSDTLYTDKPKAIIRELSCNAYDAHVAAGKKDIPFLVKLPTRLEPNFVIRDYGIGLSHNDVVTIATTYFESTKTESNDFVGALGLGSKSPFSYVDSYTITSYFNGFKRVYCAFIDTDECPKITLMNGVVVDSQAPGAITRDVGGVTQVKIDGVWWDDGAVTGEKSDDPNGLEISVPVRDRDFSVFHTKAAEVYRHFTTVPTVIPSVDMRSEVVISGTSWKITKSNNYRGYEENRDGIVAIQGNVAYPVNLSALNRNDLGNDAYDFVNRLNDHSRYTAATTVQLMFNIGDLDVAASREGLSYKKVTYDSLAKALITMRDEMTKVVETQVANCPDMWSAMLLVHETMRETVLRMVSGNATYKGEKIEDGLFISETDLALIGTRRYKPSGNSTFSDSIANRIEVGVSRWNRDLLIVADCKDAKARIKHSHRSDRVYLIEPLPGVDAVAELTKHFKGYPITLASSLPVAPKVVRTGTKNTSVGNVRVVSFDNNAYSIGAERHNVDVSKGGIYAENRSIGLLWDKATKTPITKTDIQNLNSVADILGGITVYVPYVADLATFENDPNWMSVKEYYDSKLVDQKFIDIVMKKGAVPSKRIPSELITTINNPNFVEIATKMAKTKPELIELCKTTQIIESVIANAGDRFKRLANILNVTLVPDDAELDRVTEVHKTVMTQYPFVRGVLRNYWKSDDLCDITIAAIKATDEAESLRKQLATV